MGCRECSALPMNGKSDPLLGLKENVILGKLIPAGTGLARYSDIEVEPTEEVKADVFSRTGLGEGVFGAEEGAAMEEYPSFKGDFRADFSDDFRTGFAAQRHIATANLPVAQRLGHWHPGSEGRAPEAPEASSRTVSLVDMQPSELIRLTVRATAPPRAARAAAASTTASVVMTHSMVARPGASMPTPLIMPPALQATPSAVRETASSLGTHATYRGLGLVLPFLGRQ